MKSPKSALENVKFEQSNHNKYFFDITIPLFEHTSDKIFSRFKKVGFDFIFTHWCKWVNQQKLSKDSPKTFMKLYILFIF